MKSSSLPVVIARLLIILSLLAAIAAPVAQGQVNFSYPPTYNGGAPLFVADFNGDGKPDILGSDGSLNLGNGDGTFTAGTSVVGGALAVADFNGDGKADILQQGTGTLLVLLGNGDGTFQPPISTNSGANLAVVGAADLNGDGKADVVGVFNNALLVYISHGDGTFAAGVPYNLGAFQGPPSLIVLGDFNGDHKTDVAVLSFSSQDVVLLGNGDGTFESTPIISAGVSSPLSVVVGDFNGDGKLDLAISAIVNNGNLQVATVFLQLGNGDGTFQAPTVAITGPYLGEGSALAAADVNRDGKLDLVFATDLVGIYLGNGNGTFSNTPIYYQTFGSGGTGIAIADFNSDGKSDVAVDNEILLGDGNGKFQGPPVVPLPTYAWAAVIGKFVNNGAPGVAALSSSIANSLYILTNDGTGTLSLAHTYTLPQPSYGIATGDVNGDGNLDLIVTGQDPSSKNWSYTVLLGNGDGSFQPPVLNQQNVQGGGSILIADFNNDHKLDLAVSAGTDTFAILLGNGNGTFGSPTYVFDGDGGSIVTADFNGDGNLDIAESGPSGLAILLGKGNGAFQAATITPGQGGGFPADLNGDGKVDLIGSTRGGIQVLLGNGDGTFNALPPFGAGDDQEIPIALADVNGDGKLDVIGAHLIAAGIDYGIFLGNGDGTFDTSVILLPYGFPPYSTRAIVQAVDMNGDDKPDLVIESPLSTVFVLINSTVSVPGTKFSPASLTFPSQTVGTSSNPTPVTLTNTGAVALTVKSVAFGGADAGEFKQTNNCTTVEPLASCTINVTFAPTATGGSSANLIVTDNAGTGSQQVVVSGTGAAVPGFTMSALAPSPASVSAGGVATSTVTITSAGGFNQSVALSCGSIMLNGSAATAAPPTCKFSPSSVSKASGTSTLTISTTGPNAALVPVSTRFRGLFYALLLPIFGVALVSTGFISRKKKLLGMVLTSMMILGLLFLAACGGGNSGGGGGGGGGGTPAGTYTISISGAAGSTVAKPVTVMLTVQ